MFLRHHWACGLLLLAIVGMQDARGEEPVPRWEQEIAPLLKRHCVKCHGPARAEGKLDLSTGDGLLRGGEQGSAIVPHDLDGSLVWKRIQSNEMPPESPLVRTTSALPFATPAAMVPTPTSATSLTLTRARLLAFFRSWISWARSSIE